MSRRKHLRRYGPVPVGQVRRRKDGKQWQLAERAYDSRTKEMAKFEYGCMKYYVHCEFVLVEACWYVWIRKGRKKLPRTLPTEHIERQKPATISLVS